MNFAIVTRIMCSVPNYQIYLNLDEVRYMYWDEKTKRTTIMLIHKDSIQVEEHPNDILSKHLCNTSIQRVRVLNG